MQSPEREGTSGPENPAVLVKATPGSCLGTSCILDRLRFLSPIAQNSVMFDSATLWTVAHQAPLSMGSFTHKYWSGLPCPPPGSVLGAGNKAVNPRDTVPSLIRITL